MNGLMMDWPLLVPSILRRAGQFYPEKEIVSRWADGTLHRMTYGDLRGPRPPADERPARAGHPPGRPGRDPRLEQPPAPGALLRRPVDRRGAAHDQLPALSRAAPLHHQPRRGPRDLRRTDRSRRSWPRCSPSCRGVERYVADGRSAARRPPRCRTPSIDYEELLAAASERAEFPALEENMAAGMCYTSATTGDPKGVLYSHRSTFLHAMAGCMVDAGAMSEKEVALPAVPMFHVNAWGMPYSCTMTGRQAGLPGLGADRPAAGRAARGRARHLRRRRADDLDPALPAPQGEDDTTSRACTRSWWAGRPRRGP